MKSWLKKQWNKVVGKKRPAVQVVPAVRSMTPRTEYAALASHRATAVQPTPVNTHTLPAASHSGGWAERERRYNEQRAADDAAAEARRRSEADDAEARRRNDALAAFAVGAAGGLAANAVVDTMRTSESPAPCPAPESYRSSGSDSSSYSSSSDSSSFDSGCYSGSFD